MFTDTHCHLYKEYYDDIKEIVEKAKKCKINRVFNNGVDDRTNREILAMLKDYEGMYAAIGIHPENVKEYKEEDLKFVEEHINDDSSVSTKSNESYDDTGVLKNYFDESFILDYLVSQTIIHGNTKKLDKQELSERLIGNVVEKIIDINEGISEEQLSNLVARQFTIIKYRNVVTDKKIQKLYREAIDKYLKKVSNLDME